MSNYEAVMNWGRKEFGAQFERAPWNNSIIPGLKGQKVVEGKNIYWKYFNSNKPDIDFDTRNYNHTLPLYMDEPNEDHSNAMGGKRRTRRAKRLRKTKRR